MELSCNEAIASLKEAVVSRYSLSDSIILGLAVALLSAPAVAFADVLEIDGQGYAWIAGPAAARSAARSSIQPTGETPAEVPAVAAPVTLAPDSAGPDRWRARIAELAAKYDLSPTLLEALVWQESRWREGAVSPVGARGLAQLMPGTARAMGVNPDDPAANLEGGARYLRQQLDAFGGDIEKALAAYNAGPGRVIKAGGVPAIRETRMYVAAILARLSDPVRR
ncbi:MAG: lytic transglycosylase domain-containing protein [Novosphingobium sp.]